MSDLSVKSIFSEVFQVYKTKFSHLSILLLEFYAPIILLEFFWLLPESVAWIPISISILCGIFLMLPLFASLLKNIFDLILRETKTHLWSSSFELLRYKYLEIVFFMVLCLFASISGIVGLGVGIFLTIAGFVPAVFYKIENPSMDIIICLKNSWYSLMFSLRPLNGFLQMLLLCVIVFISGLPALLFETLGHNTGFLLSLFIFQPFCIVTGGCVAILYEAIKWKRMNASGGPSQMRERGERRDGNNGDLLGGEDDIGASVAEIIEKDFDVAPSQLV